MKMKILKKFYKFFCNFWTAILRKVPTEARLCIVDCYETSVNLTAEEITVNTSLNILYKISNPKKFYLGQLR